MNTSKHIQKPGRKDYWRAAKSLLIFARISEWTRDVPTPRSRFQEVLNHSDLPFSFYCPSHIFFPLLALTCLYSPFSGVDDKNCATFLDQASKNDLVFGLWSLVFWKDHMPKMWKMTLVAKSTFFLVTAKLSIFLQNILWKSCLKINFKHLSHSMFCKNIDSLAVGRETCCPWILAERAIFLQECDGKVVQNCILSNFKLHVCSNWWYLGWYRTLWPIVGSCGQNRRFLDDGPS